MGFSNFNFINDINLLNNKIDMNANLKYKIESVAWEKHHAKIYPFKDDFCYVDKKFKYGYRCYVGEYQGWGICDWRIVRVTNAELKRALVKV